MNIPNIALWGFVATIVLMMSTVASQALGLTRIDVPFILGTMFTPNRERARVIGQGLHLINGWLFAIFYALIFESLRWHSIWLGMSMGLIQGVFVTMVALPLLPGVHPRMVSDFRGPEPTRLLEPPGLFARNYGRYTPFVITLSHAIYGSILGATYILKP